MFLVGTSGWQYRHWRGSFYPRGLPANRWLGYYADRFTTVELNSPFYRLPERDTFAGWRDRTPPGFRFAVKMSRYLTHLRRLRDPAEPVARFLDRAGALGDRLGPVLLQLPPDLPADPAALAAVLTEFPPHVRVAVEPRHSSWWTARIRDTLAAHGAALCWADRLGQPVTPRWRTTDFGYLRLHGGPESSWPRYGATALRPWVHRLGATFSPDEAVYVYFNNDQEGAAPADATAFTEACRRHGLAVADPVTAA
ncbi:MAG TPA: DUF72 domain-containing protein [Natronosporangium sp.]|nr:DUF72 domain-containing protein [Natronosporangium sp.]